MALKSTSPCAGVIGIEDGYEALDTAELLIDAILGDDSLLAQLTDP